MAVGVLRYDVPVAPDDGLLGVALCGAMARSAAARDARRAREGPLHGPPRNRVFRTRALDVAAAEPFLLEIDGEVEPARRATFDLFPERLLVCA